MNNKDKKRQQDSNRSHRRKYFFIFLLFAFISTFGYQLAKNFNQENSTLSAVENNSSPYANQENSDKSQRAIATENSSEASGQAAENTNEPTIKIVKQTTTETETLTAPLTAPEVKPQSKPKAIQAVPPYAPPLARELAVPTEPYVLKNASNENKPPPPKIELKNSEDSFFRFQLGLYNSRIDAEDKLTRERAIFLSELNTSLQLDFLFPIDDKLQVFALTKYNSESYSQLKKGAIISDRSLGLFTYGIGVDYVLSEKFHAQISAENAQRFFIRAVSAGQFEFVKAWTPELAAKASYNVFKNERITVDAGAGLKQVFVGQSDTITTESGLGYSTHLNFMRKYKDVPVKMEVEYATENIGSDVAKQKRQEARIILGVDF